MANGAPPVRRGGQYSPRSSTRQAGPVRTAGELVQAETRHAPSVRRVAVRLWALLQIEPCEEVLSQRVGLGCAQQVKRETRQGWVRRRHLVQQVPWS